VNRRDLTHSGTHAEQGKPKSLPTKKKQVRESEPQGKLTEVWVKEDGKSESRFVMKRIGIAAEANIIPRASGQTSIRSFITREFDKPL